MMFLLKCLFCYIIVFAVIWQHEIGHSYFYYLYGCKKNFLKVTVKPYLFFSTPAPVDYEKTLELTSSQQLFISYAGICVNIIFSAIGFIIYKLAGNSNEIIEYILTFYMTMHLGEAISYLLVGSIYPVSDMKNIYQFKPKHRPYNIIIGAILLIPYIYMFSLISPCNGIIVLTDNLFVLGCMMLGRIVFTYKMNKSSTKA